MPPTPFHPTHQTPFKSTVSTSQQSRLHHTPFESETSTHLSIADIDPSEWRYHAEGGKNVLLSFSPAGGVTLGQSPFVTPTCTYALRIPKSHPTDAPPEDQHHADAFTEQVVAPLLGDASVLPNCIRIPITSARDRDIIDMLAARIEMQRPAARRAHPARIRAETLSCIYAVQDMTAPTSSARSVLCIEIKPKWGFLPRIDALPPSSPNVEIKAKYSRYRMHRVQRQPDISKQRFEQLYDPLDLYSPNEQRKAKAIKALWEDWNESEGETNNLRLFWNGNVVSPSDQGTLDAVAHFLGAEAGHKGLLEALTKVLVTELSKPSLPSATRDAAGTSVLSRLALLQSRLDPLDVEGLAQLWLHRTQSHTLGQTAANTPDLPPALTAPLSPANLLPVLQPFLASPSPLSSDAPLEDALQAFLVAASFKDCSLLVRFAYTEQGLDAQTKLVDLDPKPFVKLAAMQATDAEVCAAFLAWLATLPSAPAASIAP